MLGCMGGRRERVSPPRLRSPPRPVGPSPHRSGPRWEADPNQRFPDPPPQLHPALRERQRQERRAAKERRAARQEQTANGRREERAPFADQSIIAHCDRVSIARAFLEIKLSRVCS